MVNALLLKLSGQSPCRVKSSRRITNLKCSRACLVLDWFNNELIFYWFFFLMNNSKYELFVDYLYYCESSRHLIISKIIKSRQKPGTFCKRVIVSEERKALLRLFALRCTTRETTWCAHAFSIRLTAQAQHDSGQRPKVLVWLCWIMYGSVTRLCIWCACFGYCRMCCGELTQLDTRSWWGLYQSARWYYSHFRSNCSRTCYLFAISCVEERLFKDGWKSSFFIWIFFNFEWKLCDG